MPLPPANLTCPDPPHCPVPAGLEALPFTAATVPAGTAMYRCYDGVRGYDEDNPGYGDTRFQPFDSADGHRVGSLYLAETDTAALLETVFHEVHQLTDRTIGETSLLGRLLAYVTLPHDLHVVDLRDAELARLGVARDGLVATSAEHYPCTRRVAALLHGTPVDGHAPEGLVWHSRQAELAGGPPAQILIVFTDRYAAERGTWPLAAPGIRSLYEGPGRERVDEIAEALGAVIAMR